MEQLIELLTQIQDLAGVAIDALSEASAAAGGGEGGPGGGEAPPEESPVKAGGLPEEEDLPA